MDVDSFINNGATIKNPNYKKGKGSKKNLATPPFLSSNDITKTDDTWDSLGQQLGENSYDLTDINNPKNKYGEYGVHVNPVNTEDELNAERANNQSAFSKAGNMLVQAGLNEVVLGTLQGFVNMGDLALDATKNKGESTYSGPISEALEKAQNDIKDKFAIYQKDNSNLAFGDFGWWMNNAVSVFSTASLLIPSTGIAKVLSYGSKLAKLDSVSMGLAKLAKVAKLTNTEGTLAAAINSGAEIGTNALFSRLMENYQEGRQTYEQTYGDTVNKLNSMSKEDKDSFLQRNPNFAGKSNEDIAHYLASTGADKDFYNDMGLVALDFMQFKALNSLWKGIEDKTASIGLKAANKEAISNLNGSAENALKITKAQKVGMALKDAFTHPMKSIEALELSEGFEEGYQGIQQDRGSEVAKKALDPTYKERDLSDYLGDSSIWEQAMWGVLGGIAFQGLGKAIGNIANKVKGRIDKKNMSPEEFERSQLTDEKIRLAEINGRKSVMHNYVDQMNMINKGINPYEYEIDPDTKAPLMEEGNAKHKIIDKTKIDDIKDRATNDFITNLTLNATDNGNYDLFKEFIQDPSFNKFFEDNGINNTIGDKTFSQSVIDKMDNVHNVYTKSIYDIMHSINVDNPGVAKLAARDIARRTLNIDNNTDSLNNLQKQIDADTDDFDGISSFQDKYIKKLVNDRLDGIDRERNYNRSLYDNHKISKEAYDEYEDAALRQISRLNYFAANNTSFSDVISKQPSKNEKDIYLNDDLKAEYVKFMDSVTEPKGELKKSLQDNIIKKVNILNNIDYLKDSIPFYQSEYQKLYNNISTVNDYRTMQKYNESVDTITKYLESKEDLNNALNDVLTKNATPEVNDAASLLRIGSGNTQMYWGQLKGALEEIIKDRSTKEKQSKKVVADGEQLKQTIADKEKQELDSVQDSSTGENQKVNNTSPSDDENIEDVLSINDTNPAAEITNPNYSPVEREDTNTPDYNPKDIEVEKKLAESYMPEENDEAIKSLEADADKYLKEEADSFIGNNDFLATGTATSIVFGMFRQSKENFNNILNKDTNSKEFNDLVDKIADELLIKGVSKGYVKEASRQGIKLAFNQIGRVLSNKNMDNASSFKRLADELSTLYKVDAKNSIVSEIQDAEQITLLNSFIDSYINQKGIFKDTAEGVKTIINIDDLFNTILNDKDISFDEAKVIFNNIGNILKGLKERNYSFINEDSLTRFKNVPEQYFTKLLDAKSTNKNIDNYMHVKITNNSDDNTKQILSDLKAGDNVDISYFKGRQDANQLVILKDGIEVGTIAVVKANETNTEFSLKKHNTGFNYFIKKENDVITSNFDNLFNTIISGIDEDGDKDGKRILQLVHKYVGATYRMNNGLTIEEATELLNMPIIKDYINKDLIKFNVSSVTDIAKANNILYYLKNVLLYDVDAVTKDDMQLSYELWKEKLYDNYSNTHYIQNNINDNDGFQTTIVNKSGHKLLIDDEDHDINTRGFSSKDNPIIIVNKEGNIVCESNNGTYSNRGNYKSGTMGLLVGDNPDAPMIALFTKPNNVSVNKGMYDALNKELTDLFTGFYDGKVSFDDLGKSLSDLFSGPGFESNNLFGGYSIVRSFEDGKEKIGINIAGQQGLYNVIIYKHQKNGKLGTGIVYRPNGDKTKQVTMIGKYNKTINDIVKEIADNATFNKTFYAINAKDKFNDTTNKYIQKNSGKLKINLGGVSKEYDSFASFVLANNCFKTNQGVKNGNFYDTSDVAKSLFININQKEKPVNKATRNNIQSVSDYIKSSTKESPASTVKILEKANIDKNIIDLLNGKNTFRIKLIPNNIIYDSEMKDASARFDKGKVYLGNNGIKNLSFGKSSNIIRLLIHEQLHAKIKSKSLFEREGITDNLLDVYNSLITNLDKDIESGSDDRKAKATAIKQWITNNKFNPTDYFDNFDEQTKQLWDAKTDIEKRNLFAEEFLVESLTQKELVDYLNNTSYNGEELKDNINDTTNKSLWQKIIDIMLKLFGIDGNNIKINSILAKEYSILGSVSNGENIATNNINENNQTKEVKTVEDSTATNEEINKELSDNNIEDDLDIPDFAVTSEINTKDEVIINDKLDGVNMDFTTELDNMDDFTNAFKEKDKAVIRHEIAENQIKFSCK